MAPPAEALAPVDHSDDPVERIAYAARYLLRGVLAHQGAVRAMISAAIVRPESAGMRPGHRFGLIDHALAPLAVDARAARPGRVRAAQAGAGDQS